MTEVSETPKPEVGVIANPQVKSPEARTPYQLQRREGKDDEGKKVYAYEFTTKQGQKVEAIFFGRDKPAKAGDLAKDRVVVPLGIPDRQSPDQQALDSGKVTFLVESSPVGLLDLYTSLGGTEESLLEAQRQVSEWRFNADAVRLIDRVVAGNIVTDSGRIKATSEHKGEATALLALLGDTTADSLLEKKVNKLKHFDDTERISVAREIRDYVRHKTQPEALSLTELVGVHLTRYEPSKDPETGVYGLRSSFDATRGEKFRTTVHFSLNHPVESHLGGNWEETPYVVIFPLIEGIAKNGVPTGLGTVDTYWDVPVGGALTLPEGTVFIKPGTTTKGSYEELKADNGLRVVIYDEKKDKQARNKATNGTIKSMGFEVKTGGSWFWGDGGATRDQTVAIATSKLAEELGSDSKPHTYSNNGEMEQQARDYLAADSNTLMTSERRAEWKTQKLKYIHEMLGKCGQNQRRALYLSGII